MTSTNSESPSLPPGPKGRRFGNLLRRQSDFPGFMEELHREYGDIVFYELPFLKCCAVFDARLVPDVQEPHFLKWFPTGPMLESCLATLLDQEHEQRRSLMLAGLDESSMRGYGDIIRDGALAMRQRCRPGTTIDIKEEFDVFTSRTLLDAVVGRDLAVPTSVQMNVLKAVKVDLLLALFPGASVLTKQYSPFYIPIRRWLKAMDDVVHEAIRRAKDQARPVDNMVAHYVRARDEGVHGASHLTDKEIRDEALAFLCGYPDAPAAAMTYGVHFLAQAPAAQRRLEQEVDEVLGDRPAEVADFEKLSYARAVFRETVRLAPPAYVLLPVRPREDRIVGGHLVPKGTVTNVGARVLHRRTDYWDRPEDFRPERWLEKPGPRDRGCPEHGYIPFGVADRSCPFGGFAERMFVFAHASFAQRLRLESASSDAPKQFSNGIGVKGPVTVTVRQRSP